MYSFILFYSAGIGINRYYEEAGKPVKEENPDAPYPFSIENLILKMRREYGLIIEKRGHTKDVFRFVYHSRLYYEVVAGITPPSREDLKTYITDGVTGKIGYEAKRESGWYPGKPEESVLDEYLRVKGEK